MCRHGIVLFAASSWFNPRGLMASRVCHVSASSGPNGDYPTHLAQFRGRTTAIFIEPGGLTAGSMLFGALASFWGAQRAVMAMGLAGSLAMIAIYIALPRTRDIR